MPDNNPRISRDFLHMVQVHVETSARGAWKIAQKTGRGPLQRRSSQRSERHEPCEFSQS
jgi:hypothetical protein